LPLLPHPPCPQTALHRPISGTHFGDPYRGPLCTMWSDRNFFLLLSLRNSLNCRLVHPHYVFGSQLFGKYRSLDRYHQQQLYKQRYDAKAVKQAFQSGGNADNEAMNRRLRGFRTGTELPTHPLPSPSGVSNVPPPPGGTALFFAPLFTRREKQ
jgi:hypothetical protein